MNEKESLNDGNEARYVVLPRNSDAERRWCCVEGSRVKTNVISFEINEDGQD